MKLGSMSLTLASFTACLGQAALSHMDSFPCGHVAADEASCAESQSLKGTGAWRSLQHLVCSLPPCSSAHQAALAISTARLICCRLTTIRSLTGGFTRCTHMRHASIETSLL